MAKTLKTDAITETALNDFVAKDSDFGFEMRVLRQLRDLQFECLHSGMYQDPVSGKIRQFDIRARRKKGNCRLELAVECKNLRANYPLLLSSVPRTTTESFHQLIEHDNTVMKFVSRVRSVQPSSAYNAGEVVGKKTNQVGYDARSGDLLTDDSPTFEKLNQAIGSCNDLVNTSVVSMDDQVRPLFTAI